MNGVSLFKRHSFPLQTFTWNGVRRNPVQLDNDGLINPHKVKNAPVINSEGTTEEREARLESALVWIRRELADMRHQDKFLTRQFIQLRTTIQRIKDENTAMLEEMEMNGGDKITSNSDGLSDLSPNSNNIVPRTRDGRPLIRKSYSMVV